MDADRCDLDEFASVEAQLAALIDEFDLFLDETKDLHDDLARIELELLIGALTGTVSVTAGTAAVTGTGTAFTTELAVGDAIKIGSEVFTVSAIASPTSLTLDSNHVAGASGATAYRRQGVELPGAGFIQYSADDLEYWWKDTRGTLSVTVEVGPFRLPRTKKTKSGNWLFNKTCIRLVDGEDASGSRTWVKITRQDPTNAPSRSVLWPWNPSDGTITKCAGARFNWESVGLARTSRCDPSDRPRDACSLD